MGWLAVARISSQKQGPHFQIEKAGQQFDLILINKGRQGGRDQGRPDQIIITGPGPPVSLLL
eukprot:509711-Hanusia_phi.AAC.1